MRILLTNDDGIAEPGLAALRDAAEGMGDITVVAPASHQSAASHAISLAALHTRRVRVERHNGFEGIAVEGSPADCVRLAILELLDNPPDLVLSGINAGANVGYHVFYSGTVAAACEATMLGVPAVAFSMALDRGGADFRHAIGICRNVLAQLARGGLGQDDLINVNLPTRQKPKGIKVVRQSQTRLRDQYEQCPAPPGDGGTDGQAYRICAGGFGRAEPDTDVAELSKGFVTITPLKPDMTDQRRFADLARLSWDRPAP